MEVFMIEKDFMIVEYSGFSLSLEFIMWFIIYLGNGFIFYKILNSFLTIRDNKYVKLAVILTSATIAGMVIFNMDYFNITASVIIFFISNTLFFKNSFIEKITAIFILYPIVVSFSFLRDSIFLGSWNIDSNFTFEIIRLSKIIFSCIFWFILYKSIKSTLLNFKNSLDHKSIIFIDIICTASFVSIYSAILFTPYGKSWQAFATAVACIITNIGIVFLAGHFANTLKLKKETAFLKTEKIYYTQLANNQKHLQKIKHDMDNHLAVVSVLLSQDEYSKAMEYCNHLTDHLIMSNRAFCKNSIVNAILNAKYQLAIESEIDCFVNINLPELLPIEDIALCSIFANSFDNAIEACIMLPKVQRNIEIKAITDKGIFSFSIKNTFIGKINTENNRIISSKSDGNNHGFGIAIIENIVNKYHGTIDISYTETHFQLLIIIKI